MHFLVEGAVVSLEVTIFMNYDVDYKGSIKGRLFYNSGTKNYECNTEFVHNKVLPNIHFKRNGQQEKER